MVLIRVKKSLTIQLCNNCMVKLNKNKYKKKIIKNNTVFFLTVFFSNYSTLSTLSTKDLFVCRHHPTDERWLEVRVDICRIVEEGAKCPSHKEFLGMHLLPHIVCSIPLKEFFFRIELTIYFILTLLMKD